MRLRDDETVLFLRDPVRAVNRTRVFVRVNSPTPEVATGGDALRHLKSLARPIRARRVSRRNQTVMLELCAQPKIVVGHSPHTKDHDDADLHEILCVLAANGLDVVVPAPGETPAS